MQRNRWLMWGLCAGLAVAGCSTWDAMRGVNTQTWPLTVTTNMPAAAGQAKVTQQKDGNTKLEVKVARLAPPEQAAAGASAYVVWVTPSEGGAPQNMGALRVDKNLNGSLTTLVPFTDFEVRVTAEADPYVTTPTHHQIMHAAVKVPKTVH
jgi:hypothetical protein